MRRARAWIGRLAVVGLSLTWLGCGGGGVPDPSSDSAAAPDTPSPVAATAPPAEAVAKNDPAPAEAASTPSPASSAPTATASSEEPVAAAPATKGDASGTTELLNLANNSAPPAEEASAKPAAAAPGAQAYPGSPGGSGTGSPPGYPGAGGSGTSAPAGYPGAGGSGAGAGSGGMPAGYPGAGGGSGTGMPAGYPGAGGGSGTGMPAGYPGAGGGSSGGPGAAGYPGGPGGGSSGMPGIAGGNDNGPPNFRDPIPAVRAFMKAAQAKDRNLLVEATALRSPQEAGTENMKKFFATVVDQSISDDAMNELAKTLEGYQIVDANTPKSTGRFGVILGKSNLKGGQFRRTITVRKEAKGWKVVDIGGQAELEAMPNVRNNGRMPAKRK